MKQTESITMEEIKARKEKLEKEIHQLENDFETRVGKVQRTLSGTFHPLSAIKKHPFKAVGTAVLVGFVLGLPRMRKSTSKNSRYGLSALLFDELKRLAARKAVEFTSEFVDEKISSMRNSSSSSRE